MDVVTPRPGSNHSPAALRNNERLLTSMNAGQEPSLPSVGLSGQLMVRRAGQIGVRGGGEGGPDRRPGGVDAGAHRDRDALFAIVDPEPVVDLGDVSAAGEVLG